MDDSWNDDEGLEDMIGFHHFKCGGSYGWPNFMMCVGRLRIRSVLIVHHIETSTSLDLLCAVFEDNPRSIFVAVLSQQWRSRSKSIETPHDSDTPLPVERLFQTTWSESASHELFQIDRQGAHLGVNFYLQKSCWTTS